jgi:hypothetical protein
MEGKDIKPFSGIGIIRAISNLRIFVCIGLTLLSTPRVEEPLLLIGTNSGSIQAAWVLLHSTNLLMSMFIIFLIVLYNSYLLYLQRFVKPASPLLKGHSHRFR